MGLLRQSGDRGLNQAIALNIFLTLIYDLIDFIVDPKFRSITAGFVLHGTTDKICM
jgi:hypothetical protein